MSARWLSMLSMLVIVAGCRDRQENGSAADPAQDTVAMVSPSNGAAPAGTAADTRTGSGPSGSASPGKRAGTGGRELVVEVQEEVPGLLEQARYHPLDAQHIAQGKYPKGAVQAGWLERRGGDLVYRFRIRDVDGSLNDVLVDSFQGRIINSIPVH
jgi:hypothetical protein